MEKLNHSIIICIGVIVIIGNLVLHYNKILSLPINALYVIIFGLDVFYLKKANNLVKDKYNEYKLKNF